MTHAAPLLPVPIQPKRLLVTAALPYANGPIHLGHLVEYILADIYVRAARARGSQAILVCANDAHGTPIELNAAKLGVAPEAMVAKYHREQLATFTRFGVRFDVFDSTHSEENKQVVADAYAELQRRGHLQKRPLEGNFCPQDQRFLPDRYVRGVCPKCAAPDQYGDVCEACGSTYAPTELREPRCALCGTAPERRMSEHVFFRLSAPEFTTFLRQYIDAGTLQADVANYVRGWLDQGLKDWCISRDGPYFGFPIPDMEGKFFYVWLDAPFGYVSASLVWGKQHGLSLDDLWRSPDVRIEHIIGKDIMYFHTLFWPAVLHSIGMTLPSRVHVHGMLTVNGEKMSKSRGTFIMGDDFAAALPPEALRYYNASKYTAESRDIDLSFADFCARVNGELINKHVNLFSRLARFVLSRLDGKLPALPFRQAEARAATAQSTGWLKLAATTFRLTEEVEAAYAARDIALVTRLLAQLADAANEAMQTSAPWALIVTDRDKAAEVCAVVAAVAEAILIYLAPIVPQLCTNAAETFAVALEPMQRGRLFADGPRVLQPFHRLLDRLEIKACEDLVAASMARNGSTASPPGAAATVTPRAESDAQATPSTKAAPSPQIAHAASEASRIPIAAFQAIELRVGTVVAAEAVAKSKKLLKLQVDLAEAEPRQILAGLKETYAAEDLLGTQVIVVANLQPAKLMGLASEGMVLASDDADGRGHLLRPSGTQPNGAKVH